MNGKFILFLVLFGTYQIICELFLLGSTIESFGSELFRLSMESRYL